MTTMTKHNGKLITIRHEYDEREEGVTNHSSDAWWAVRAPASHFSWTPDGEDERTFTHGVENGPYRIEGSEDVLIYDHHDLVGLRLLLDAIEEDMKATPA